ncbi:waprin-Thr1 [Microplitis mediator]|uniref:waprin-Thr1 n=1 Tax=Microplitis mediator TaxID=375433 RepID=UPI0025565F6C|nr:waprin-Thr1 [Microplitis mediator]
MDVKIIIFFCLTCVGIINAQGSFKSGYCPLQNRVTRCMPTCMSDYQCGFNEKCCPNKCNSKSCTSPSPVGTGYDGGYKGSGGNDVNCGGSTCNRYQKCEFNRSTKRYECVRT